MENENTNENKKKQKVAILIGVVTLLVALLGATYAYFQISIDTESSNTNITGSTPPKSLVTLTPGISNLHLNISANDMSLANATKEYYGTDSEDKSYEEKEEDGTKTIASVELTGGEETTKYSCTTKLTVSKVTEPDDDKNMIDVLQPGDIILQFKGNVISNRLDLSDLKTTGSKEYDLSFIMSGNTKEEIKAYIKLKNKNENQNYLAGHKLNIDISTSDLKCNVFIPDPKIAELREKDTQGYLSKDLQGGMYRYQAEFPDSDSSEMTNWICFGTSDLSECTDETDIDDNNIPDGIDKYMYRIIGITEDGQMYLLKETFIKEGKTTGFAWNSKSEVKDCLGEACEWPKVDLYKRLNGTESNGNPIFVNSTQYEYLKSGDEKGTNDGIGSEWYTLIADHNWMYGDTNEFMYYGNEMYGIETGKVRTRRIWPDERTQTTCSSDNQCIENNYTWGVSVPAKVGLMYMNDIYYGYPGGNPENYINVKNSWIHFQKDGYNKFSDYDYEWLITRYGAQEVNAALVSARYVYNNGLMSYGYLSGGRGVRPTFYLSPKAKIKDGDGTKTNPYILDVKE